MISIYFFLISPIKASFSRSKQIVQSCFKPTNVVLGTPLKWSASRSLHFYVLRSPVCKMYRVWVQNSGKNNQKDPKRQTLHSLKTNIGIPVGIHIRYCICSQNHDPAPSFNLSNNLQDFWFSSSSSFAKLQSFSSFWHCAKRIKGGCWFYSRVAGTIGTVQSHLEPIGSVYMCIPPCVIGKTCIVSYGDVVSFSGKLPTPWWQNQDPPLIRVCNQQRYVH